MAHEKLQNLVKVGQLKAERATDGEIAGLIAYMNFRDLQQLRRFADQRDWERSHSPKNLSMALSVEAAELLEHFQWLTEEQSASLGSPERNDVAAEIADIQIYLAMLADKLSRDCEEPCGSDHREHVPNTDDPRAERLLYLLRRRGNERVFQTICRIRCR